MSSHFVGKCKTLTYMKSCKYVEMLGQRPPQYQVNSFQIVCTVLALDSWRYCPTSSSQCFPIWLHWIRGCGIPCDMPPCGKGINLGWQHLIFHLTLFTLFNCIKKIVQFCKYVGLSDLAIQSNSFSCLVLLSHRELGNFRFSSCVIFEG